MSFPPGADLAARLVQAAGGELVAAPVKVAKVVREAEQEAELLDADVGARKVPWPAARVGSLDERFKNVQGGALNAIAEEEALGARKAIEGGDEPEDEAVVQLEGVAGFAGTVPDGLCGLRPRPLAFPRPSVPVTGRFRP